MHKECTKNLVWTHSWPGPNWSDLWKNRPVKKIMVKQKIRSTDSTVMNAFSALTVVKSIRTGIWPARILQFSNQRFLRSSSGNPWRPAGIQTDLGQVQYGKQGQLHKSRVYGRVSRWSTVSRQWKSKRIVSSAILVDASKVNTALYSNFTTDAHVCEKNWLLNEFREARSQSHDPLTARLVP